jgi:hypothetical protein
MAKHDGERRDTAQSVEGFVAVDGADSWHAKTFLRDMRFKRFDKAGRDVTEASGRSA